MFNKKIYLSAVIGMIALAGSDFAHAGPKNRNGGAARQRLQQKFQEENDEISVEQRVQMYACKIINSQNSSQIQKLLYTEENFAQQFYKISFKVTQEAANYSKKNFPHQQVTGKSKKKSEKTINSILERSKMFPQIIDGTFL